MSEPTPPLETPQFLADILYRPEPVVDAMQAVLDAALPTGVVVAQDAAEWVPGQVVLECVGGPTVLALGQGGPDYATVDVQVTCITVDRPTARALGSLVRVALTGVGRSGVPVYPLTITNGTDVVAVADPVTTAGDGLIGQDNPCTWVETYRVRYQKV